MIDALAIVPLTPYHAPDAARLHILGQPGTFLTSLGPEVLTLFYQALPQSPTGFGFAALAVPVAKIAASPKAATVLGFVSGTTGVGRLFLELGTRRLPEFLPPLAARFARQPGLAVRSLQTLAYPWLVRQDDEDRAAAELLAIMVEPQARSLGIGALLLQALLHECSGRAVSRNWTSRWTPRTGVPSASTSGMASVRVRAFTLYGRGMFLYARRIG